MKLIHNLPFPTITFRVYFLALLVSISAFGLLLSIAYGDTRPGSDQPLRPLERPVSQSSGATPSSGAPGSRISVSGSGFHSFAQVQSIKLSRVDILGNRTISTGGDGRFQVDGLVVPGLDPGIYSLVITVGTGNQETTATATFQITAASGTSGSALPANEALDPLGDALERVFKFDNTTKTWSFYDPRPEFADINTLTEIVEGQVYWVKVTRSITVTLNGEQRQLSCANEGTPQEDCWNLVVW